MRDRECIIRNPDPMTRSFFIVVLLVIFSYPILTSAQTVSVDATPSHVVNKLSPLYALGSTVDRVPDNSSDIFFRPDQIKQSVAAGWGLISYRQNTDLFVQAWHWNPEGTWSYHSVKGY